MEILKELDKSVFRGYDIRGVAGKDLDTNFAYTIGKSFGSYLKKFGKDTCLVGHDNRISSDELYNALIKGLLESGTDVISLGLVTTPMYYYAAIKYNNPSGIMVTASHNPKDDNGFKMAIDESGNIKGKEIEDFYYFTTAGNFTEGKGHLREENIRGDYLKLFKENLHFGDRRLKVVIDPGNGTTSIIAEELYKMFPIDLITINGESDGTFPNHHPDPCVEENLDQLKAKVKEEGADVGLAFDGDGDRLGVVSSNLNFIPTDQYMIIIIRDIINKVSKKEFLYDIKCSKALEDEIEKLGGKGICFRTGNSYTKTKVRDDDLPFGGELSGHVYFRDRWPGFDSGLYAGLRLLEILSKTDKTVDELLEGMEKYYSTEEIKFASPDDKKFNVVERIKEYAEEKNYKYLDIDGVKVLYPDAFALVRASNTGPNITARFEAKTKERLEELEKEFTDLINKYNN
ncbi:MAG: phosphomannomutase/phosphoglucomutase [Bacilli bacterium]|nr:phosphomannomutase/phosphoglucomutase [Bacilli bacterium]